MNNDDICRCGHSLTWEHDSDGTCKVIGCAVHGFDENGDYQSDK
jgi:hypothetical protein